MDNSQGFSSRLPSEEIVKLVLLSINSHYRHDAKKIEAMLDELKNLDEDQLVEVFQGLRNAAPIEEAIPILTNWIQAKISSNV